MTENPNPTVEPMNPSATPTVTVSREDKFWAMFCHLGGFAFMIPPIGQILLPLAIWLLKKGDSGFIDDHGKESLNFQITITIMLVVGVILMTVLIGFLVVPAVLIYDVIMIINATNAASNGQRYRYPYTLRFIK